MSRTRIFKRGKKVNQMRIYRIWTAMKQRCYNSKQPNFKYYGGRGITVCEEWIDSFVVFYKWAMANGYKKSLSLDRKNNGGNYAPSNCRWATSKEQADNRRIGSGVAMGEAHFRAKLTTQKVLHIRRGLYSTGEYAKMYNVSPSTVSSLRRDYTRWPNAIP